MDSPIRCELDDDGTAVINVLGEIDYGNSDEVAQAIRDAVAEWRPRGVRVDLRGATFVDSTGLGALIEGYRATVATGGSYLVVNPSAGFRRVLTVTGLCELFGIADEANGTADVTAAAGLRAEADQVG